MAGSLLAPAPPAPGPATPAARKGRLHRLRRALSERRTRFGLLNAAPVVIYLLVLFVYPIFSTLLLSFKGEDGGWTLYWYANALQGSNLDVLLTTLRISAETSLLSLVIGFLLAAAVSRLKPLWAGLVMIIVIVPHFISALVRTYGWIILLGEHGVVNNALTDLKFPGAPFQLLYNEIGVVIGTTSVMLPYTVLLLYAVMKGIDRRLPAAAASMGAGRLTIFRRVYLPMVAPGLVNAGILCFILCLGYYLTPALMGGPKQTMVASLISEQVMKQSQWNGAAALGIILLVLTFAGLLLLRLIKALSEAAKNRGIS
ncbi:ABC transporter permease [Streptomyces sp. CA-210063]|uniref:ABC transporter permease n=1 Tax=Streptomyces sp. CA-210063 TaxID=2801029 RepID=UPI00214C6FB5|nr:ABC transporter permease [Streptomyces sp. CA-210063]UUU29200.1 ABC transporter permease [Streptomyces sp. CA-210063]